MSAVMKVYSVGKRVCKIIPHLTIIITNIARKEKEEEAESRLLTSMVKLERGGIRNNWRRGQRSS